MSSAQTPLLQQFLASGPANPFATRWIPTKLQHKGQNPAYQNGPMRGENWWQFSCWPIGEAYFAPGLEHTNSELSQIALNGSNLFSFLKVEVEYSKNGVVPRCVTFDIGAGLDVFFPPSSQIIARVLVPDPTSFPEFLPAGFVQADFASLIAINAVCVHAPVGRRMGTYTDCRYITDAPQNSALVNIQRGAKNIQVFSDGVMTSAEDWFFGWQRPPLPDIQPSGSVPASTSRPNVIPSSAIPGTANVLVMQPDIIPAAGQIVCVVQELEF